MMINVQGRQFELAVRRMVGATKIQVIALLGVQSMSFAIPSVVIGLPCAHYLTMYLFTGFNQIAGVTIEGACFCFVGWWLVVGGGSGGSGGWWLVVLALVFV